MVEYLDVYSVVVATVRLVALKTGTWDSMKVVLTARYSVVTKDALMVGATAALLADLTAAKEVL